MTNNITTYKPHLPAVTTIPVNSLDAYITFANSIPMLSAEEEYELAHNLRYGNDLTAAQSLILPHLRFVIRVARGFAGYGLQLADLIQEGNIGLMKAVKRFDPAVGVRLVTFAVHWIKAEIHEFVIRNWRIVKVATTKAQRKLFFNIRKAKKRFGWFTKDEINSVARDLNVKPKEVIEMEKRMSAYDPSFDMSTDDDSDKEYQSPAYFLAADNFSPEDQLIKETEESSASLNLQNAISKLDERSREIIKARWLTDSKATLQELAAKFKVSAERIRQLENKALKSMKLAMA